MFLKYKKYRQAKNKTTNNRQVNYSNNATNNAIMNIRFAIINGNAYPK